MDQKKIGAFLKILRNEKGLTQEQLAEQFYVSPRTVSRWETGSNMPDLGILVELADTYDVDIKEIINGERQGKNMDKELKTTLETVAEYSDTEKKNQYQKMQNIIGALLAGFGAFLIIASFAIIPRDSGWGAKGALFGCLLIAIGAFQFFPQWKLAQRIGVSAVSFLFLAIALMGVDALGVHAYKQIPRFAYVVEYGEDEIVYQAPFCTAIRHQPDTSKEWIEVK